MTVDRILSMVRQKAVAATVRLALCWNSRHGPGCDGNDMVPLPVTSSEMAETKQYSKTSVAAENGILSAQISITTSSHPNVTAANNQPAGRYNLRRKRPPPTNSAHNSTSVQDCAEVRRSAAVEGHNETHGNENGGMEAQGHPIARKRRKHGRRPQATAVTSMVEMPGSPGTSGITSVGPRAFDDSSGTGPPASRNILTLGQVDLIHVTHSDSNDRNLLGGVAAEEQLMRELETLTQASVENQLIKELAESTTGARIITNHQASGGAAPSVDVADAAASHLVTGAAPPTISFCWTIGENMGFSHVRFANVSQVTMPTPRPTTEPDADNNCYQKIFELWLPVVGRVLVLLQISRNHVTGGVGLCISLDIAGKNYHTFVNIESMRKWPEWEFKVSGKVPIQRSQRRSRRVLYWSQQLILLGPADQQQPFL